MSKAEEPAFMNMKWIQTSPSTVKPELTGGLTKRELFAAMALQGLCTNPTLFDIKRLPNGAVVVSTITDLKKWAIAEADMLLADLERK